MNYRPFGKTGFQVSALGFGCMRLPRTAQGGIDEDAAARMLQFALEQGVNYFDTAYGYHDGKSELFLGEFFRRQGGRGPAWLATKLPVWLVKERPDFDRYLNEQLAKLQTDALDVYLLHGLNRDRWDFLRKLDIFSLLEKARKDGRIRHVGFSFHDETAVFKEIVDGYDGWDMCQIQHNYMDVNHQAGREGLLHAVGRGLAVVIMEPLLGGRLVDPPPVVQAVWDSAAALGIQGTAGRSAAEWALQWLWNQAGISSVLSGMSSMAQVQDNIASAGRSGVGTLSAAELELVARAGETYQTLTPIPCTACGYCMPCPNGVDIPRNFSIFNSAIVYDKMADSRKRYRWFFGTQDASILGSSCIQCLECESKCPQQILISQWMPYLHEVLDEGRDYDPQVPAGFTR